VDAKIPIHLLAGFLGSGKTTTLKRLLENTEDKRLGVIVNDVASVNIDAKLVNKRADNGVIKLQNGCACCSLADELLTTIENLLASGTFDSIIIELSGVADPVAIKNNWKTAVKTQSHPKVTNTASLENVITLVDACTFGSDFMTYDRAGRRWTLEQGDCTANRQVVELLAEQVEAANLVILNKRDMATEEELEVATSVIQSLNEDATILRTSFGEVSASQILKITDGKTLDDDDACHDRDCTSHSHSHDHSSTACTDPDCTDTSHSHSHRHENGSACADPDCTDTSHSHSHSHVTTDVDNLGISSFVYKATRPFDANRLMKYMYAWPVPNKDELDNGLRDFYPEETNDSPFVGVLRSKGFCWMAPTAWDGLLQDTWRANTSMYWSHAGKHLGVQVGGRWWASVDRELMKDFFADNPAEYGRILAEDFVTDEFGDRRQEIVFIGVNLQEERIRKALDECLLTDEELDDFRKRLAAMKEVVETQ
jgi:G3E family GTPase